MFGGIFDDLDRPKKSRVTPEDKIRAQQLWDGVAHKIVDPSRSSVSEWAQQFARLRTKFDKTSPERIDEVLEWYLDNIGKDYTPFVYSGKAFREKFVKLVEAMKRDRERNPVVVVTEETKKLLPYVNYIWPKGAKTELPKAFQLSLDNCKKFFRKIHQLKKVEKPIAGFLKYLQEGGLPQPGHFTVEWFRFIAAQVGEWEEWSGSFKGFILTPKHKFMYRWGRSAANRYCGRESAWDRLVELVDEN